MAIVGIPEQIETDNAPAYVSTKMKQFFYILQQKAYCMLKNIKT